MPSEILDNTADVENASDGSTATAEDPGADPIKDDLVLQSVMLNLVKHYAGVEKFSRRPEVMDTRRQRFYWRSDQYILWNPTLWAFIPVSGGGGVGGGVSTAVDMPRYTDVYNIYTPYGESLIAPLSQNPPGVNFEPDDPGQPGDVAKAKAAEKYKQQIDRDNNMKQLRSEVARLMYTDTRVVLYSRPVADEQELGADESGKPNTKQLISAHGTLETKVIPIAAKSRDEAVVVFISDEIDINLAKEKYPNAGDKITVSTSAAGEQAYERYARLGVLQGTRLANQSGDALKYLATRHRVWLRPAAFNQAEQQHVAKLKELYPNGCKVVVCGDAYCKSTSESLDDHLSIGFATPGDGMSRPSLGKRMVPLQDRFNDGMNLWAEADAYCIPVTFMVDDMIDGDALREQMAESGNHIMVDPPATMAALADAFYEQSTTGIPATLIQALEMIQGPLAQFMTGALPALLGQGEANNKTKGGIEILRDQAMGRLGIAWGAFQELFADAYLQSIEGAAAIAEDGSAFVYEKRGINGNVVATEQIGFSDLKKGNIRSFPDIDASFPETTNAKRNTYLQLAEAAGTNPALAEALQLPDNQELGHELMGLTDFVIPGAEARQKQLEEIQQLLKETPIPPPAAAFPQILQQKPQMKPLIERFMLQTKATQEAQQGGMQVPTPVPPKPLWPLFAPSVDVDQQYDFHNYEYEEIQRFLSSSERREQDKAGNQIGVLNVWLHGIHHFQAMQAQKDNSSQKPPSESVNFKDLPPEGQVQMAAQAGIKINPPNPILEAAKSAVRPQATQ